MLTTSGTLSVNGLLLHYGTLFVLGLLNGLGTLAECGLLRFDGTLDSCGVAHYRWHASGFGRFTFFDLIAQLSHYSFDESDLFGVSVLLS